VSGRVFDSYLSPSEQFSAISWGVQTAFRRDDVAVRFVLDQHAQLDTETAF